MTHNSVSEEQKEAVESILNGSSDWGCADWNRAVSSLVELLVHERQAGREEQWQKDLKAVDDNVQPEIENAEEQNISDVKALISTKPE